MSGRSATNGLHRVILLPLLLLLCFFVSGANCQATAARSNPVLPGDHPDPTIILIGNTYWTTSTSGDWAPEFPLFHSHDLHHWTAAGAIFPQTPSWASGSFWAPELVSDGGRVLVYYVARKRDGPLCVAVATAGKPQGPYVDHGPILCEPDGSIDPAFVRDEQGQPFLIWKEDGNSIKQATPIFAQPLSTDLLHLTGTPTRLIVNDPESWEGGVVEAPYVMRHKGRFYLFYAGNACCGTECRYAEGVARADHLLGPWEKNPSNPIIAANDAWRCPGHGTAVQTPAGQDYFMYHAYPAVGTVFLGRESVIDPITWAADGWPAVNRGLGVSGGKGTRSAGSPPHPRQASFIDNFSSPLLSPEWKWPIEHPASVKVGGGSLTLSPSGASEITVVAGAMLAINYVATVGIKAGDTPERGLAVIGNRRSTVALTRLGDKLQLTSVTGDHTQTLWQSPVTQVQLLWLRVTSGGRGEAIFSYSLDHLHWTPAGDAVSVGRLPPWDQGLRIGLVARGEKGKDASFVHFSLTGTGD